MTNEKAADDVNDLLKQIINNYNCFLMEKSKEYGYTVPQLILMRQVYLHPDITIRELSERMGLAKSTVSGIVDRLEVRNAVVRRRDEADRRSVKVSLAPAMVDFRVGIKLLKNNYMANLLDQVSPDDVKVIIQGLTKLNELMQVKK